MPTAWPQTYPPTGGYANTWNIWVTATTTTASAYPDPWTGWVTPGTVGTFATAQTIQINVWNAWNHPRIVYGGMVAQPYVPPPSPTPEQIAKRARLAIIQRNRERARTLRRRIADRRAELLLLTHLDETQREEWTAGKAFHVETADGRRRYRIALGMAGNVRLVKADGEPPLSKRGNPLREGARFCMHVYHPDEWVPDADNVLAQKLLLECEGGEAQFLALANVS